MFLAEFYKAQAMRLPTFDKPRVIACGEELANHIALPRGCLAEVIELLKSHRIKAEIDDQRFVGNRIEVEFSGQLRPLQKDAATAFAHHDEGILCAPTAFGKTAVAAWLIAARKVNTGSSFRDAESVASPWRIPKPINIVAPME
jgi:hypothetical protein